MSRTKEKTSFTLSKEVRASIARAVGSEQSRSAYVDAVLARHFREQARSQIEARDLDALNRAADELAPEIEEVLKDQAEIEEPQ